MNLLWFHEHQIAGKFGSAIPARRSGLNLQYKGEFKVEGVGLRLLNNQMRTAVHRNHSDLNAKQKRAKHVGL
jgi:hypothetical protein